jgi:hypothetical protein
MSKPNRSRNNYYYYYCLGTKDKALVYVRFSSSRPGRVICRESLPEASGD